MAIAITIPRLGWTMEEGIFLGWLKQDGDRIKAGEPIFTLESEKAAQEIEATESGILRISPAGPGCRKHGCSWARCSATWLARAKALNFRSPPYRRGINTATAKSRPRGQDRFAATPCHRARASDRNPLVPNFRARRSPSAPARPEPRRLLTSTGRKSAGTGRTGRIRERDVLAAASGQRRRPSRVPDAIAEPQMPGRMAARESHPPDDCPPDVGRHSRGRARDADGPCRCNESSPAPASRAKAAGSRDAPPRVKRLFCEVGCGRPSSSIHRSTPSGMETRFSSPMKSTSRSPSTPTTAWSRPSFKMCPR